MEIAEEQIAKVVERVVAKLGASAGLDVSRPAASASGGAVRAGRMPAASPVAHDGVFKTMNEAVAAAKEAFIIYEEMPLSMRDRIIEAVRSRARLNIEKTARMAVEETGLGRVEDKVLKNRLAVEKTPGTEILETIARSGDNGLTLTELAPYGVIGSITPCTNPTATIVNNCIGMLSAGNSVVINAHPTAREVTIYNIREFNQAIIGAGGPANLITTVSAPTIGTAQELMKHRDVALLVVTGGPAVVQAAMASGKKVIAAGPGNPPVVVDETADIPLAARHIVEGASFDNNIVCILEKEIIAVEKIADQLLRELKNNGAYILNHQQARRLEKVIVERPPSGPGDHGAVNKKWVGKDASLILRQIDVDAPGARLAVADLPKGHPFVQMELLMPVLGLVRVKDVDEAIETAMEVEHGFRHTAVMHSRNIVNLSRMARVVNTSIFVKNAPSTAGLGFNGEGYTSFTIASPTGEGLTTARHFTRERRCTLKDSFRII